MNSNPRTAALAVCLAAATAHTQSLVTVDTTQDVSDSFGTIADLPGPDGMVSLREAVNALNATPGVHTIEFAIDRDPADPLGDLLRLEESAFVAVTRAGTTIDFLSQARYEGAPDPTRPALGMIHLHPAFVGEPGVVIGAAECTVIGLGFMSNTDVSIEVWSGDDNRFYANRTNGIAVRPGFGTVVTGTQIGGTDANQGNDLGLVELACGANDSVVVANRITQVSIHGSPFCADGTRYPTGNRIGGPTPQEGNLVNGFGRTSGEGRPTGAGVEVSFAQGTLIQGNTIGTDEAGTRRANSGVQGVFVWDSNDTTIAGNLISGIRAPGVAGSAGLIFGKAIWVTSINDTVDGVVIENNRIGTDATGTNPVPTYAGIEISPTTITRSITNVRIGGPTGDAGNVIAFTDLDGITIAGAVVDGVDISGNSIFANGLLGIDLRAFPSGSGGVTENDDGDADEGPNGLQNFPVIDSAAVSGGSVRIIGALNSLPSRDYRIDLYASPEGDGSGHGEGQRWLGNLEASTDTTGQAGFDTSFPAVGIDESWIVAATATDIGRHATSEFSAFVEVSGGTACPVDLDGDGELTLFDFLAFQNLFDASDPRADFDGDGDFTLFDFLAFQNAFDAGCG
ncbi:MAG: hypothetical protein NCW75_04415 [Phycisphaera sp.]|nr:MAG: hypothetical protein NCW75_04415 [Phycisphaera sp.]